MLVEMRLTVEVESAGKKKGDTEDYIQLHRQLEMEVIPSRGDILYSEHDLVLRVKEVRHYIDRSPPLIELDLEEDEAPVQPDRLDLEALRQGWMSFMWKHGWVVDLDDSLLPRRGDMWLLLEPFKRKER